MNCHPNQVEHTAYLSATGNTSCVERETNRPIQPSKMLSEQDFARIVANIVRAEMDAEIVKLWGPIL